MDDLIKRLEALEAKATKGPWLQGTGSGGGAPTYVYEGDGTGQQCNAIAACYLELVHRSYCERTANAALIVELRNNLPAIISALRQPTQSDALAPHLGTVCYKTSDQNRSCDRIYNMTDTIPRQAVIDAIAPLKSNGTDHESCIYDQALDEAIAAINAIPAATVTDGMLERGCAAMIDAYLRNSLPAWDKRIIKKALVAALGE